MARITGRVLSLPSEADVREEAARLGVDPAQLAGFAAGFGGEMVKLSGVTPGASAALQRLIASPAGLALAYPLRGAAYSRVEALAGQAAEASSGPGIDASAGQGREASGPGIDASAGQAAEASRSLSSSPAKASTPGGEGTAKASTPGDEGTVAGHKPPAYGIGDRAAGQSVPPYEDEAGQGEVMDRRLQPAPTHHSVLLAGPLPLLRDVSTRLEFSNDEAERAAGVELRATIDRYLGRQMGAVRCGGHTLEWGERTYVMGIINVTPDSFSGDGLGPNLDAAVAQGLRFVEEGAHILDVGGESTRPGSETVSDEEEIARVVPLIERLAGKVSLPISVDTYKVGVARRALDAGACIINDIWGLHHDPALADLAAERKVPLILMHNRRAVASRTDLGGHFKQVEYEDLMEAIVDGLRESVEMAVARGVKWENVIVDPGIGFGKTPRHNLVVMRRQRELRSLGRPVLMGTSRKSFIGLTLNAPPDDRVEGTGATVALSIFNGADIVRVHDVREMARIARMTDAMVRPSNES